MCSTSEIMLTPKLVEVEQILTEFWHSSQMQGGIITSLGLFLDLLRYKSNERRTSFLCLDFIIQIWLTGFLVNFQIRFHFCCMTGPHGF